jgi:hypothetical protein
LPNYRSANEPTKLLSSISIVLSPASMKAFLYVLASLSSFAMATTEVCEDFAMDFSQYERGTYITDNFVSAVFRVEL